MALELARFALWLKGFEEGKPLGFLDHHIVCGDALLGITVASIRWSRPIPYCAGTETWCRESGTSASGAGLAACVHCKRSSS
jgi:hypothetical protein